MYAPIFYIIQSVMFECRSMRNSIPTKRLAFIYIVTRRIMNFSFVTCIEFSRELVS
jgi:hypothetical protein